ncbi:mCG1041305, partial [Mus musculus]
GRSGGACVRPSGAGLSWLPRRASPPRAVALKVCGCHVRLVGAGGTRARTEEETRTRKSRAGLESEEEEEEEEEAPPCASRPTSRPPR